MTRSLLFALLFAPAAALAVPMTLNQQGRLIDAAGDAIDGSQELTFKLYDSSSSTSALWTETQSLELEMGHYSAALGAVTPFEPSVFEAAELWLGIAVGASPELSPRVRVHSVPFAITAGNLRGGVVDATEVRVNGAVVIGSDGQIPASALSADRDTLGGLACEADQIAVFDGASWTCGDAASLDHTHDAEDVTQGVFDVTRLPVGNSADTVAAGDHSHDAAAITTGKLAFDRLPVGTSGAEVAAGNHTHDAAAIVSGRLDNARLPTDVVLAGTVKVGASSATCDAAAAGRVRQGADGRLEICVTNAWTPIALANRGHSANTPGQSCLDILDSGSSKGDGVYWVRPSANLAAYQVYCDMTTNGGGWALLLKTNGARTPFNYDDALWTNATLLNGTDLTTTVGNAKYNAFVSLPVSTIRGCFPNQANTCVTKQWTTPRTALATFSGPADVVDGHPGFNNAWSTQPNCKKFGVNTPHQYLRARFGFTANQENDCGSNDTAIGFGVGPLGVTGTDYNWGSGQFCGSSLCSNGNKNEGFPGYLWGR